VKIIAVAVVKPSGKLDVLDAEIRPWNPPQSGGDNARRAPGLRPRRGVVAAEQLTGGGLLSAGSKLHHAGPASHRRPSTAHIDSVSPENFSLHNSRNDDGLNTDIFTINVSSVHCSL